MWKATINLHNLRALGADPIPVKTIRDNSFTRCVAATIPELMVLENDGKLKDHCATVDYVEVS